MNDHLRTKEYFEDRLSIRNTSLDVSALAHGPQPAPTRPSSTRPCRSPRTLKRDKASPFGGAFRFLELPGELLDRPGRLFSLPARLLGHPNRSLDHPDRLF